MTSTCSSRGPWNHDTIFNSTVCYREKTGIPEGVIGEQGGTVGVRKNDIYYCKAHNVSPLQQRRRTYATQFTQACVAFYTTANSLHLQKSERKGARTLSTRIIHNGIRLDVLKAFARLLEIEVKCARIKNKIVLRVSCSRTWTLESTPATLAPRGVPATPRNAGQLNRLVTEEPCAPENSCSKHPINSGNDTRVDCYVLLLVQYTVVTDVYRPSDVLIAILRDTLCFFLQPSMVVLRLE